MHADGNYDADLEGPRYPEVDTGGGEAPGLALFVPPQHLGGEGEASGGEQRPGPEAPATWHVVIGQRRVREAVDLRAPDSAGRHHERHERVGSLAVASRLVPRGKHQAGSHGEGERVEAAAHATSNPTS